MYFCDFGNMLRTLRKSRNLTQAELGSYVGLSKLWSANTKIVWDIQHMIF